ncbi:carbohydrate ABC transporter substrate-binding protein [Halosimplex litoreum]|uniref:Carbohydrate ABC transporter substrate-binding protein n=1 Tax=Halosimplex litoreum TaxID=1198301 RepID=A0A7T3FYS6_9EURY|nr:ABC transporter substrate-binding protein [Halosimplex litoreum]QPV63131.1 carbohydrate ABC transporter substrate-binding protein [Halosimplex litoreum]
MSTAVGGQREIEIHHHFVWGSEQEAMDAVLAEYTDRNPNVSVAEEQTVINALRLMIKSRILREDPPDVWDEWPGANLRPTVEAGATADITELWERTDMDRAYFDGMVDVARFDGEYHAVPLDMHRISNLYYNVELFEAAGVDPARLSGPTELAEALPALAEQADQPIAVFGRNPFGLLQLWETLFLAHEGPSGYREAADGRPSPHRAGIRAGFDTLGKYLAAGPDNPEFMDSSDLEFAFSDGEAACINNGSWSTGHMAGTDMEFGHDWDCVPFPGTDGTHIVNTNAIVPAAHTEGDDEVMDFVEYLGSAETIERFNTISGSVPPRSDVSVAELHPMSRELHDAFGGRATQLPSMCHGLAVQPEQVVQLKDAVATFLQDRDADAAADTVVTALS